MPVKKRSSSWLDSILSFFKNIIKQIRALWANLRKPASSSINIPPISKEIPKTTKIESDQEGFTPLMRAVDKNDIETVSNLLKSGVDVNYHIGEPYKTNHRMSVLALAVQNLNPATFPFQALFTALEVAVQSKCSIAVKQEMITLLFNAGAKLDPRTLESLGNSKFPPLNLEKVNCFIEVEDNPRCERSPYKEIVDRIQDHNEQLRIKTIEAIHNSEARMPKVITQIIYEYLSLVDYCLKNTFKTEVNAYLQRHTPLMAAASKGNLSIMEQLIKNKVDVNYATFPFQALFTALEVAVQSKCSIAVKQEMITLLFNAGAKLDPRTLEFLGNSKFPPLNLEKVNCFIEVEDNPRCKRSPYKEIVDKIQDHNNEQLRIKTIEAIHNSEARMPEVITQIISEYLPLKATVEDTTDSKPDSEKSKKPRR